MKLKNPIITSSHILSLYPIHEAVPLLADVGYDGIEIWAAELREQLDKKITSIDQIKRSLSKTGMIGTIHGPLKDHKNPGLKLNISSKNEGLQEISIALNMEALEWTKELGFDLMVVHPGHTDHEDEEADDHYWGLQIDAFKTLAKKAEGLGIRIGLEPMENRPKEFVKEPAEVDRLIREVGSEAVGITFDMIHAYSHGADAPLEFLDPMHKNIFHVHVSGHSKDKNHVPFSMSIISHLYLDKIFEELVGRYKGPIAIEGSLKGITELTKEKQKKAVEENLEYIRRDLKSLHLL